MHQELEMLDSYVSSLLDLDSTAIKALDLSKVLVQVCVVLRHDGDLGNLLRWLLGILYWLIPRQNTQKLSIEDDHV